MGRYFGTDGFRGEANVDLTADHAHRVGRFLGWYYGELKRRAGDETPVRVVIGKDTRRSSYMLEYALASGLVSSGADAYLLHVTTTPSVSYVARTEGFDCGIMISASHNPYYDNGIKLISGTGEKMDEDTIALIEDYLDGKLEAFGQTWQQIPLAQRDHIGRTVDHVAGRNRYVGRLISLGMFSFKGMKVGLDCANGSAWTIAKSVFDALGAKAYVMGDEPDGYNINSGVGSTHIDTLRRFVVANGLDIGFAYDGDADRCLAVDEQGTVVTGDHILYVCGKHMKQAGELPGNTVVTTIMSNFGLYRAFDREGIAYAKTAVGDSILGYKSHMGAGSITSNVKSDKTHVVVTDGAERIDTGRKKVGAMLGDGVEVGCNSVLNPGSVIGRGSRVYPLSSVRGTVPAASIYKRSGDIAAQR